MKILTELEFLEWGVFFYKRVRENNTFMEVGKTLYFCIDLSNLDWSFNIMNHYCQYMSKNE